MEATRRLFVGIVLSDGIVGTIRRKEQCLVKQYPHLPVRWTPLESLYIEVASLGYVSDMQLPDVLDRLRMAVAQQLAFDITLRQWVLMPSVEQPKMVWLMADSPSVELGTLKTIVERVLAPQHPSISAYRPHITLGRIVQKSWRALEQKPQIAAETICTVAVERITLFEKVPGSCIQKIVPLAEYSLM